MHLSVRQIKRLWKAFQRDGERSLISRRRGRASNNRLPAALTAEALEVILGKYADFGPTLAHEKLTEVHGLHLSVESVRQLMIADGLWHARRARRPLIHQMRARRRCLGELVQIDGSPHRWFEDRAPRCTLLVFIDDAIGRLMQLLFVDAETTFSYFATLRLYIAAHGKPASLYSDKFGVFRARPAVPDAGHRADAVRAGDAGTRHPEHLRHNLLEDAFRDRVFSRAPNVVPAGESLIWSLAKETGKFDKSLCYPAEGDEYEKERMDALGL